MKRRGRVRVFLRQAGSARWLLAALGGALAGYLRLVNRTSRLVLEPEDPYAAYGAHFPVIIAMWHGQHFMLPFLVREGHDVRVLISRHRDGEINAIVAEKLGLGTVRGSAARDPKRIMEKGGVGAFLELRQALAEGATVAMTADLSNGVPRRAGLGIVQLARATGRPIVPVAFATSRRIDISSWDRATLNLPFSQAACVVGPLIEVAADAEGDDLEARRQVVERELNEVTGRAYAIADGRDV